jgi:lipopolysaccharide export system protein LptA
VAVKNKWTLGFLVMAGVTVCGFGYAQAQGVSSLKKHDVNQPIDISADELEVQTKDNTAIFRGHVEAIQSDLNLKAERVTVYYREEPGTTLPKSGASAISRIDASGNVVLSSPSETVHSKWGVYDLDMKIVTLGGSVVMAKNGNNIRGDRLQLDLVSGVTRIEGGDVKAEDNRVRGRFVPPARKD